jgi:hypothetical protein
MKPIVPLILSCLVTWGACSDVAAAPVISPFAADLAAGSYSSDRTHPSTTVESVFNGGYWNSGTWGTHWVQADMGTAQTLSQVILTIGLLPENVTWQNVYLSDTPIGADWESLTPVASRVGFTTTYEQFVLNFAATSGRYLQVVSNGGASWTALGDASARSDWVDPAGGGGGTPPHGVPEPDSLALLLAAGAAARAFRPGRAARA